MRYTLLFFLLYSAQTLLAQPSKSLQEAEIKHQIEYTVYGKRGEKEYQSIEINIKNISRYKLKIKILPGTIFLSQHDWVQNQVIVKEIQITLNPKEEKKVSLTSMCIQNSKSSPPIGEKFPRNTFSEHHLFDIASLINQKGYQKSPAQSAIWVITDDAPSNDIYSLDTTMVKDLCAIVSKATGKKCPGNRLLTKPHHISYISSSIAFLSPTYINKTQLSVYDLTTNTVLKTYWKNRKIVPGYHHFKIGYTHHGADSTKFKLRLQDENGTVLSERIIALNDTIPKQIELSEETYVTYELQEPITSRVGIYNEQDELYLLLADDYKMNKGFRKTKFIKGNEVPFGQKYFLKVKNTQTGKEVISKQIYLDELSKRNHKSVVRRGTFSYHVEGKSQKAKLAVYNSVGELVWVVFGNSTLGHGIKIYNYSFEHNEGPKAFFYVRMTDEEGIILKELKISPK